jgi:hypothetical protein
VNRRATKKKQASYGSWILAIVVLAAIVAAGVYLVRKAMQPQTPASTLAPAATTPAPASASTAPAIQHPISQASAGPAPASTAALPALVDSDASVLDALSSLVSGGADWRSLLVPSQIISRVVATVDALPRSSIGSTNILPLRTPKGTLQTDQANGITLIGAHNADRYQPYMAVLENVDPHTLVAWYKHNYPLFQQAYRELGYPRGYFNDRLVVAIDDMLAAPDLHDPVAVTQVGSRYVFVDQRLQFLSAGQKLMIRLGPANEAQFKAKLRMIRELVVGGQVAH